MSDWYDVTGSPGDNSALSSSTIRAEFAAIAAGLTAKLPTMTGNNSELVVVNSAGTALETTASLAVAQGGTGAVTLGNGEILIGGGTGAITSLATLTVALGGTGAVTLTDGGILLGSGTGAVTAMSALADGAIVVGDGTTDPVSLTAFTSSTGTLKHEYGGIEADISAIADGGIVVGTGTGTMAIRAGAFTGGASGFLKHEVGGLEVDISAIDNGGLVVGTGSGTMAIRTQVFTNGVTGYVRRAVGGTGEDLSAIADGGMLVGNVSGGISIYAGAMTSSTGYLTHEVGGLEADISTIVDGDFIVGTGAGTLGLESGNTARTSLGLGTGDSPTFTGVSGTLNTAAQPNITSLGTLTSLTMAGALAMQDNQITRPILVDYATLTNAIGSTGGGTQDIDLTLGNSVTATVDTSANTFTFSNPSASDELCAFSLVLTNGGSQTVNWPASVDWEDGVAPVLTTSGTDVLVFFTVDGGTIWHGIASSLDSK